MASDSTSVENEVNGLSGRRVRDQVRLLRLDQVRPQLLGELAVRRQTVPESIDLVLVARATGRRLRVCITRPRDQRCHPDRAEPVRRSVVYARGRLRGHLALDRGLQGRALRGDIGILLLQSVELRRQLRQQAVDQARVAAAPVIREKTAPGQETPVDRPLMGFRLLRPPGSAPAPSTWSRSGSGTAGTAFSTFCWRC